MVTFSQVRDPPVHVVTVGVVRLIAQLLTLKGRREKGRRIALHAEQEAGGRGSVGGIE